MDPQSDDRRVASDARGRVWRLEAIASGFVALLALIISAYTVYVQRQQLKVQAWPRLAVAVDAVPGDSPGESGYGISLKNRGVAPAEIRAVRLSFDDEDVGDWSEVLKRAKVKFGVNGPFSIPRVGSPVGEILGVGDSFLLLETGSQRTAALLSAASDDLSLSLCYCSVLDDCWVLDVPKGDTNYPTTTPVERCPVYPKKFTGVPPGINKKWAESILDAGMDAGPVPIGRDAN